jgi:hypothetical protein
MWVDDPDFNLDYHVRPVACPAPGDLGALCEFMSSVYAYKLDRSRPLWMCWVVEGLAARIGAGMAAPSVAVLAATPVVGGEGHARHPGQTA